MKKYNKILKFNSNFESGNLSRVYFVSEHEYDLFMSVDSNSHGHSQWF